MKAAAVLFLALVAYGFFVLLLLLFQLPLTDELILLLLPVASSLIFGLSLCKKSKSRNRKPLSVLAALLALPGLEFLTVAVVGFWGGDNGLVSLLVAIILLYCATTVAEYAVGTGCQSSEVPKSSRAGN